MTAANRAVLFCRFVETLFRGFRLMQRFQPVFAEQFDRVLSACTAVPAAKIIGGTVLPAAPADALGVRRMNGEFGHGPGPAIVTAIRSPEAGQNDLNKLHATV